MSYHIEFTHTDKSTQKNLIRETFSGPIDLATLKNSVVNNNFSGIAIVYEKGQITWKVNVREGKFHGEIIKYIPFIPKTIFGTASGYIGGWRQAIFVANFNMDLLDGPLYMYRQDGTKHFVFNYNMGLLDGEQKHYVDYSKFVHTYRRGEWESTEKVAKSWLWADNANEINSHSELKKFHEINKNMF
jgi:antitoxin component YwqK of YwqJK toxin-antitoxin module